MRHSESLLSGYLDRSVPVGCKPSGVQTEGIALGDGVLVFGGLEQQWKDAVVDQVGPMDPTEARGQDQSQS